MEKEYYIIVDLNDLSCQTDGISVGIEEADKFKTYEEALEDLKKYDQYFQGAIYKVKETTTTSYKLSYQGGYNVSITDKTKMV